MKQKTTTGIEEGETRLLQHTLYQQFNIQALF